MISNRYDHLIRVLLLGETGVGKTCILCRFATDDFVESHISTIGIDFKMKTIDIEDKTVKVQIWDTAGQERFEAITQQFYRKAQGVLLVYDICNRKSFEAIPKWLKNVRQFCEDSAFIIMVGNKCDKEEQRQVPFLEALAFSDGNDISIHEVSARNKNDIDELFLDMCKAILSDMTEGESPQKENTSITIETTQIHNTAQSPKLSKDSAIKSEPESQGNWCCTIS